MQVNLGARCREGVQGQGWAGGAGEVLGRCGAVLGMQCLPAPGVGGGNGVQLPVGPPNTQGGPWDAPMFSWCHGLTGGFWG